MGEEEEGDSGEGTDEESEQEGDSQDSDFEELDEENEIKKKKGSEKQVCVLSRDSDSDTGCLFLGGVEPIY